MNDMIDPLELVGRKIRYQDFKKINKAPRPIEIQGLEPHLQQHYSDYEC